MTTLTQQRIRELLEDIKKYEDRLNGHNSAPEIADELSMAWTTLTIAKAKLTALKGERK